MIFRTLAAELGTGQPVYAIQTLEQDAAAMASASFEQMIDFYIRLIREVQPSGPYRLAGWCVSGWIAYGVARRLEQLGQQIEMVMIIDAWAPTYWTGQTPVRRRLMLAIYHAQRFRWMKNRSKKSNQPQTGSYFQRSLQSFTIAAGKFVARLERWANPAETRQTEEERLNNHLQATARHASETGPLLGRALLFRSEEEPTGPLLAIDMGWSELIGRPVQVEVMPGDHHQIFDLPGARMMAIRARAALGLDTTSSTGAKPVENLRRSNPRVVGLMRPLELTGFLLAIVPVLAIVALVPSSVGVAFAALSCAALLLASVWLGAYWQLLPLYLGVVVSLLALLWMKQERPRWIRATLASAVTCLLILTAAFTYVLPMFSLPKPTGTYAIGTRVEHLVDPVRMETHVTGPLRPREIMVQIWYPAVPHHQHLASYRTTQ